jgi:putative transposase
MAQIAQKGGPIIYSDQSGQFGSDAFNRWGKYNYSSPSISRSGNCWDNTVAESFFSSLKSELLKKRIYPTRAQVRLEIFEYIEEFYNRLRRHKHLSQLSPMVFEQHQIAL